MKKILLLKLIIFSTLLFGQTTPNAKQVLTKGNDAGGLQVVNLGNGTTGQAAITLNQLNDSIAGLNAVVTELAPVISILNTLPGSTTTGNRYLVSATPTAGHANQIAEWNGSSYDYTVPVTDNVVFVTTNAITYRFNGTAWVSYPHPQTINQNGNSFSVPPKFGSKNNQDVWVIRNKAVQLVFGNTSTTFTNPIVIPATYIAGGYSVTVTGISSISGTNTGDQINISGNAATVTTNANLSGAITSVGNATSIASQIGTGTTFVMSVSPTFPGLVTTPSMTVTGKCIVPTLSYTVNSTDAASLASLYSAISSLGGICGVSNGVGIYTYYSTIQAAITAASSGQCVEVFADITETGAVTIILKDGVSINFNGHTYTLTNAGAYHCFQVTNSTNYTGNITNGNVVRTNSGGYCFNIGHATTGVIDFSGCVFTHTGSGKCFYGDFDTTTLQLHNILANSNGNYPIQSYGGSFYNCVARSTGGVGFAGASSACKFYNCTGIGNGNYGMFSSGLMINCIGICPNDVGFGNFGTAIDCRGYSISSIGFYDQGTYSSGNKGISTSGIGYQMPGGGTALSPTGISSSNYGFNANGACEIFDIIATTSTGQAALLNNTATVNIYGGKLYNKYNNSGGYGIYAGVAGANGSLINLVIKLSNTSAPYIKVVSDNAATFKISPNSSFSGGVTSNSNITSTLYGLATLSGGTVTVSTVDVNSTSRIFLTGNGGTLTNIGTTYEDKVNRVSGTSFIIKSSNILDAANVAWEIHDSQ